MKKYITNHTNYIKHRHSDNACSKAKRKLILKVPILRQQKIDLLSKYSYFKTNCKKDGMKIIQRCNTKRCKTVVSLYNPGIEFTILADNTMLECNKKST
jgi:hypothetical protein